jgi:WD40 repeat protein
MRITIGTLLFPILITLFVAGASEGQEPKLELVLQMGQSGKISHVGFSADGKRLLATSVVEGNSIVWDAETGNLLREFRIAKKLYSAALSPDGKSVLTGADPISLWDVASGKVIREFRTGKVFDDYFRPWRVTFSPDGRSVLIAGDSDALVYDLQPGGRRRAIPDFFPDLGRPERFSGDGKRILWSKDGTLISMDVASGKKLATLAAPKEMFHAVLSHNGKRVLTMTPYVRDYEASRTVICWDVDTGKKMHTFAGHKGPIESLAFSQDGEHALVGLDNATVLYEVESGKKGGSVPWGSLAVAFSPDGLRAFNGVVLWDIHTGQMIRNFARPTSAVKSVFWTPNRKKVIAGGWEATAIWDMEIGRLHRTLNYPLVLPRSAALSPDGRYLFMGKGFTDWRINVLWDLEHDRQLKFPEGVHELGVAAFSPDGKAVVTPWHKNSALLWELESAKPLKTFVGHEEEISAVAFSQSGKQILTGSGKTAILWDVEKEQALRTLRGDHQGITVVRFRPDGKQVLTGCYYRTPILWETESGKKIRMLPQDYEAPIATHWAIFSPDGKQVVSDRYVWDSESGQKLCDIKGGYRSDWDLFASFSPDGRQLQVGPDQLDSKTGQKIRALNMHGGINAVAYAPDGTLILTGSEDGSARLWEASTGKEICRLLTYDAGNDWLVTTPDGYFDGSENAAKIVSYRIVGTLDFVPLERYRKQFERPGLLAMIMKRDDYRNKGIKQDLPPVVRIVAPKSGMKSKDGKVTIEAEAVTRGEYPVTAFRLLVNGTPYEKKLGRFELAEPKTGKSSARWDIELEPGKHTITVHADTKAVFGVSESINVRYVGGNADPDLELPNLYVFAVGISKYREKADKLDYAHRDAEEIAKAYQTYSQPLFKKIEVKVLTDEEVTHQKVMSGLGWLGKNLKQRDYAVFFFAGHATKDKRDKLYFLPANYDKNDLPGTAISGDQLASELEYINAVGRLTVLLDACHSGAIKFPGKQRNPTENLYRDLTSEEKGMIVMCSATGREPSQESHEHRHGYFTLALIEGLSGKGNGKMGKDAIPIRLREGAVYAKHLDVYVTERVSQLSSGYQHPVTPVRDAMRDFPVSRP